MSRSPDKKYAIGSIFQIMSDTMGSDYAHLYWQYVHTGLWQMDAKHVQQLRQMMVKLLEHQRSNCEEEMREVLAKVTTVVHEGAKTLRKAREVAPSSLSSDVCSP